MDQTLIIFRKLLQHKIMNHTGYPMNGPKCFPTTKRTSFVDIRDDDIPGPGTHDPQRIDKNTPSEWKFGNSTERDTFLQKYPRPYPSPSQYNPNPQPTINQHPKYSIPKQEHENAAQYKQDDMCTVNYRPNSCLTKPASSKYTFGYAQEMNYQTDVPPPNNYSPCKTSKNFNKTQNNFTKSPRPLPYGDWGKNPGTGEYYLHSEDPMNATAHTFGNSKRPKADLPTDSPGIYYFDRDKTYQHNRLTKGYTMRPYYQKVKNKDLEYFPPSTKYLPKFIESKQRIISYRGPRSQIHSKEHSKYPSPQKYVTSSEFYKNKKDLSFTKDQSERYDAKIDSNPGPGTYQVARPLNDVKGYMGKKIKDLTKFITPGADNYEPNDTLTRPTPQRPINYRNDRTDFSKSITGNVGPGDYKVEKQAQKQLGKISKSLKFEKNRNKNPGPGFYEIPGTIGVLPKYYSGPKKTTRDGFSTHTLAMNEKTMRNKQRQEQLKRQQEEEAKRREQEQEEEKQ